MTSGQPFARASGLCPLVLRRIVLSRPSWARAGGLAGTGAEDGVAAAGNSLRAAEHVRDDLRNLVRLTGDEVEAPARLEQRPRAQGEQPGDRRLREVRRV